MLCLQVIVEVQCHRTIVQQRLEAQLTPRCSLPLCVDDLLEILPALRTAAWFRQGDGLALRRGLDIFPFLFSIVLDDHYVAYPGAASN